VGIQGRVSFFFDGIGQPVAPNHYHRIQVVGF
jgi:hypothetical protein